ncbi:hypothetical protein [Phyllobacterium myrsinacearum]|uniref:MFS family permease n=1 Tax=Phyllobacterium myrsinacearum TaxID=28101 RepID=A0A839ELS3_9HYPH|nr:hypothetical protein [Phyllobacterium myrsinacearum]MBA8879228.1 MFS family permease [Phyllobacterium myrsinacearum]
MNDTFAASTKPNYTLADFLSTYRYWALFFSSLFAAAGVQGLMSVFPLIAQNAASTPQTVAVFYLGSTVGWVVGAFVAFIIAARNGWAALISSTLVCGVVTVGFLAVPWAWGSLVFLFLFGVAVGTVRAVFPLAIAILLVSGRPGKIDFACALTLMSTTILISALAPMGAAMLFVFDQSGLSVIWSFPVCLLLAILVLLPARHFDFDEAPRQRHKPLPQHERSPVVVAIIFLMLPILLFLIGLGTHFFQVNVFDNVFFLVPLVCAAAGAIIYFAYWVHHIHGELAGAAASQRLLTPLGATLIAIFVPLGLPVLVMTLGDLLNDRVRDRGKGALISITWLAVWSVLLPPLAMAMIQNGANKSYATA